MMHINNFFPTDKREDALYTIENGTLALPFVLEGQYFLIEGSVFNDGIYQYPATDLVNESFEGTITALAIPKAFLQLVEDIEAYESTASVGEYTSESFGGYSYQRAVGANGCQASWKDLYRSKLNTWRKV
ncbi:MAG: hypothetical protein MJ007_01855 [Paludibacteraceae bacterium]|nr:hypothetical protein [Paludibacteraceae bacterium]